jgi:hypothetical protein
MSGAGCSLAALVSSGGPVRVALRPCCLVALVGPHNAPDSAATCSAAGPVTGAREESAAPVPAGPVTRDEAQPAEAAAVSGRGVGRAEAVVAAAGAVGPRAEAVVAAGGGVGRRPESVAAAGRGVDRPGAALVGVDGAELVGADAEIVAEAGAVP